MREMDLLFAPRHQVVEHFASLLAKLKGYCAAVEALREHHTGVAMLESAVQLCEERLAEPHCLVLELLATFHIAAQVQANLHADVMHLLEVARV